MFQTKIQFPTAEWVALRQALKRVPEEFVKKVDAEIAQFAPDMLQDVTFTPGAVARPIEWTPSKHSSDRGKKPNVYGFGTPYYSRQKAAYYASNGFGKGIPSRRSGKLQESWTIRRQGNQYQSSILISNSDPKFPYVIGKWQQKFHANTGWKRADRQLNAARQRVRRRIMRLMVIAVAEAVRGGFRRST